MTFKDVFHLLKTAGSEWMEAKAPRLGAALAYYTVFSMAPLLLLSLAIAGMVFREEAAEGQIVKQIEDNVGRPAAEAAETMLKHASDPKSGILATIIAGATLLFGASAVFGQLQDALNTIWEVEPKPGRGIWGLIKDRFLSFTMVLGTGFLLLVSLVISAGLSAVAKWLTPESVPGGTYLWQGIHFAISFGLITLLFAMIYKVLPDVDLGWKDVWIGAVVTTLLFTLGKYLLGLYIAYWSVSSGYGAAGSLVVLLVWVYYSAQILLFGAEITRVYANRFGSGVKPTANAVALSDEHRLKQGQVRSDGAHSLTGNREKTEAHR